MAERGVGVRMGWGVMERERTKGAEGMKGTKVLLLEALAPD
jgi:hypothetical protein